jgi:biopolymer transport protein ExbD
MKIKGPAHIPEAHVELVPLIDCVFLLLIFFMCAATMAKLDTSSQISLPDASNAAEQKDPKDRGTVNIPPVGMLTVTGETVTEARPFFVFGQLVGEDGLKKMIAEKIKTTPNLQLYIRCDKDARFKLVRRAMAACAEAGVDDVIFGTYGAIED